jgi:hypothetical protein
VQLCAQPREQGDVASVAEWLSSRIGSSVEAETDDGQQ